MKYLVQGSEGPGFYSPDDTMELLEKMVIPSLEELMDHEEEGAIVGGLPVGDRAFLFVVEAESNDDLDRMLRSLPIWGLLEWEVTPLQDFEARLEQEKTILGELKKGN